MNGGALGGLRVLDATAMFAGPLAAMRLGDLGADVIKIEPPVTGEYNRSHGFTEARVLDEMPTFLSANRNKRSLAVNLKHPDGRQVLLDLARQSDVFIQNFRSGVVERLGIGYDDLAAVNPRLVYCSISGYGSIGPYRNRPGQDLLLQGYSGSMFTVGAAGDPPTPGALLAGDAMTGYQAAIGILAALRAREFTGVGQHVEVDMLGVILDCQIEELVTYLNAGVLPQRTEEQSAFAYSPAPYGVYRTANGWLTLAMSPLPDLGEVLDDDWLRSLVDYADGYRYKDEIYRRIRHAFEERSTAEWLDLCQQHGVWAGPVYSYDDLVRDEHVKAAGYLTRQPQSRGEVLTVRPPIHMSTTQPGIMRGAPELAEHSEEILADLGYNTEKIQSLASAGAIGVAAPPPQLRGNN